MDKTPIYDIKPYLPYTDCHPDAKAGFAEKVYDYELKVECSEELINKIPQQKQKALLKVLAQDPRPSYQDNPNRRYGVEFMHYDVRFHVQDSILKVCEIVDLRDGGVEYEQI